MSNFGRVLLSIFGGTDMLLGHEVWKNSAILTTCQWLKLQNRLTFYFILVLPESTLKRGCQSFIYFFIMFQKSFNTAKTCGRLQRCHWFQPCLQRCKWDCTKGYCFSDDNDRWQQSVKPPSFFFMNKKVGKITSVQHCKVNLIAFANWSLPFNNLFT